MTEKRRIEQYTDIIDMPHHLSKAHQPMPRRDRAAQFAPFAALTGHEEALEETARVTERSSSLDAYEAELLDRKLQLLSKYAGGDAELTILYFQPDERKEGGRYQRITGYLKRIDSYRKCLILRDGSVISLEQIRGIDSSLFDRER